MVTARRDTQLPTPLAVPPSFLGGGPRLLAHLVAYIYSPKPYLGRFLLKDKCSMALEVYETQCTRFSKSKKYQHTILYQVKPTVVASGLKSFNEKVYCTTSDFSTAVLDNIIPIYKREKRGSNAYKGLYVLSLSQNVYTSESALNHLELLLHSSS